MQVLQPSQRKFYHLCLGLGFNANQCLKRRDLKLVTGIDTVRKWCIYSNASTTGTGCDSYNAVIACVIISVKSTSSSNIAEPRFWSSSMCSDNVWIQTSKVLLMVPVSWNLHNLPELLESMTTMVVLLVATRTLGTFLVLMLQNLMKLTQVFPFNLLRCSVYAALNFDTA